MAQVKLILREDIEKLGHAGDLVSVKPGYARNFLLAKGKANLATEARIKELEHHRRMIADEQAKTLKDLEAARAKIEAAVVEVEVQAGVGGKLFGSVTLQQVADLLAEKGIELDRRKMHIDEPIKTTGEHELQVRLHREVVAKLKVVVTASGVVAPPEDDGDDQADSGDVAEANDEN
jgi:large subunit ribosomal protein L9